MVIFQFNVLFILQSVTSIYLLISCRCVWLSKIVLLSSTRLKRIENSATPMMQFLPSQFVVILSGMM
jgi:hypothetical protein